MGATSEESADQVSHLLALGLEVAFVGRFGGDDGRKALCDLDSGEFERFDLRWIVCDEADGVDSELLEDFGGELEFAAVGFVAEFEVGFDSVETLVLKFVGAELCHQTDAASFLLFVEQNACAVLGDHGECELKLLAAVAAEGMKDVAGEALGVNSDDGRFAVNVAHDESHGAFNSF